MEIGLARWVRERPVGQRAVLVLEDGGERESQWTTRSSDPQPAELERRGQREPAGAHVHLHRGRAGPAARRVMPRR